MVMTGGGAVIASGGGVDWCCTVWLPPLCSTNDVGTIELWPYV